MLLLCHICRITILSITLLPFFGCSDRSSISPDKLGHQLPQTSLESSARQEYLQAQWDSLVYTKGGCLTGGQYVRNDEFGGMGCVMSVSNEWKNFYEISNITEFLIEKITSDTTKTRIHTCPFLNATEAEIAVYALHRIHRINWYDFSEFSEFQNREIEGLTQNYQAWLQTIIDNGKSRLLLKDCWRRKSGE